MPRTIAPIVEGHGDVPAAPILIRRLAAQAEIFDVDVKKPIRIPKQKLQKAGELRKAIDLAVQKSDGSCGILILLDADRDCPAELGPTLLRIANTERPEIPTEVVVANTEYESWFLGSIRSLLDHDRAEHLIFNSKDAERIRGAKEKLAELLNTYYSETVDQAAYSATFDLREARVNCPSFDKLCRSLEVLLRA